MMPNLVPGRQSRRFQRLQRMDFDLRIAVPQEFADTHNSATGTDARDEGVRDNRLKVELPPNLRTGSFFVGFDIRLVGELSRKKYVRLVLGKFFRHANTAK